MIFLAKIFLAHILGDFVFQPKKWVREKEDQKFKSPYFYLHILIHFLLLILILGGFEEWRALIIIPASHLIIDGLKVQLQTEKDKRKWFFFDQFLHLTTLLIVALVLGKFDPDILSLWKTIYWLPVTALVFLSYPAAILIQTILNNWIPTNDKEDDHSLSGAGKWIGIIERLMIFTFMLLGQWQAIGFLLAAKSVFRFGDLSKTKDRKLTEYILIGTFLSFGIAMLCGLAVKWLMKI